MFPFPVVYLGAFMNFCDQGCARVSLRPQSANLDKELEKDTVGHSQGARCITDRHAFSPSMNPPMSKHLSLTRVSLHEHPSRAVAS